MSSVPRNKDELELAINLIFPKLMADYRSIPESKARKPGVEGNVKGTVISVSDTVAYLIGWGKLVLKWYHLRSQNQHVDFPESGYKWNQLGSLAESFHEEYCEWKYDDLLIELESTVRISVIANACFGLFRTPEPALFLFPYFYSKCSDCASFLIDSPPSSIR
ncbi:ClbS/DfsB family four-helix bundle protein [Vibrio campbellii]|uniref:ClbS/DfsB family four-helix bundle protein n=1 Tax=Vibrio campbellii TaxID=680 RepID=UPI0031F2E94D